MSTRITALLAVLLLALAACNGDGGTATDTDPTEEATAAAGAEEGGTVGLALSTLQNPFFVSLRDGAEAAAEEAGVELLVSDAQDDAQAQADDLQNFISQGVDVIVVNPVDSAAVVTSIEAANEAGIPVVTVDRGAEGGEVASHIASDNVLGGRLAGEYLFEQIGGSGAVAQLEGVPGTSAARDRGAGFQEALDATDGVELVANQTANFNREEGFDVTQNILQGNPDLDGLFAQNDEMALGAVEASAAAGAEDLVIVGFDATDDAIAAIQAGDMAATVAQRPELLGELGIQTAARIIAGEEVEAEQPVEVQLVTSENVDEFASS